MNGVSSLGLWGRVQGRQISVVSGAMHLSGWWFTWVTCSMRLLQPPPLLQSVLQCSRQGKSSC